VEDRLARSTISFGIHYERAVLAWMDEVVETLSTADEPSQ